MQEKVVEPLARATQEGTLADLPVNNAADVPGGAAFSVKADDGSWSDITWLQFLDDVNALAKGLVASGIKPGDPVGLMSRTRYEWTLVDFAAWTAGAVVVPIYETSSAEQIEWIVSDSGAKLVIVESAAHRLTLDDVLPNLDHEVDVEQIDAGGIDDLVARGVDVPDEALVRARAGQDRSTVATIIYTSGTTGRPKGVQLTHGNFMDLSENALERLGQIVTSAGASTVLFLPLAHVFARFIEILCVMGRARMGHAPDIKHLLDDFAGVRPTFVLAVPRVFEKIYNSAEAKAIGEGKGKIFAKAAATAIDWSRAQDSGGAGFGLKVLHGVFDKLVYGKLRTAMGGQVAYAVSGGGPLGERLGHFFRGIGVIILEGYGLTETTAPISVNTPDRVKIGTVGAPLPGSGIRIAEDGEILLKGIGVFSAYHGNEEATAEAVRDGWFHTGDIGELDEDGFLRITGRKKEILITAGGKNVAPAVLEDRLRAHPLVSQCIVVGDKRPFIGVLVTLDDEMWPTWAANNGLGGLDMDAAREHPLVLEAIQGAVDDANRAVSKAESIRKFIVLPGDFTEANGYLTPSMKLRRHLVMDDFAEAVESLYS